MDRTKTIFITSFYGLTGRNILSTNVLKIISKDKNIRTVILLPEAKKESYENLFGSENVIVEGVPSFKRTVGDKLADLIFFYLSDLQYWRISRGDLISRGKYIQASIFWLLSKLGYSKTVRSTVRFLDYALLSKRRYKVYFEKYKPDLVYVTDIFRTHDIDVAREAHSRGIFVLGMFRSWDNVSTKGLNRFIPDGVIVPGEKIKEEVIKYCDIPADTISVVGIPHYDRYISRTPTPREEFFKKLNLDPHKKTLLISPPLMHYANDPIAESIVSAFEPFDDIQLVVRLQLIGKANLGRLISIPNKVAIDAPASADNFDNADITTGDEFLSDLLYHCDGLASYMSTLAIDAIVFGKPSFYIGFNTIELPYHKSMRWFYDVDCARELIETGGVNLSKSPNELVGLVLRQFAKPSLGSGGRRQVIDRYCFRLDGGSGERLARTVIETLFVATGKSG